MYEQKKRYYCRLYLIGLVIIAGMAGLSGCSSSDEMVENNPTYDPAKNTVMAQLVLTVSTNSGPNTRMSEANTQAATTVNFRGIEQGKLLTYQLATDGQYLSTPSTASKIYQLGTVLDAGATISATDPRHVMDLELDLNTNTMLFYGKAPKSGSDDADHQAEGYIDYHVDKDATGTYFQLLPRQADFSASGTFGLQAKALTDILNGIITSGGTAWATYGTRYKSDTERPNMNSLEKDLGEAYVVLTSTPATEARAGSGSAILRTVYDLWTIVKRVEAATHTTDAENAAHTLAGTISTQIAGNFVYDATNEKCTFVEAKDYLKVFPTNFNLPIGAAQLNFGNDGKFAYKESASLGSSTQISCIMWPAELCYFGNSPIRTSTAGKVKADFPNTISGWQAESWTDFVDNSKVGAATRTVAMRNPINYGTSMLKTTVKYGAATLEDNNAVLHSGEEAKTITVSGTTFELTGILISGQYNKVGWDYLPMSTATNDYIIFDNAISNTAIPNYNTENPASTLSTDPVYTLVFDNYVSEEGASQSDVTVCLEFKNNSGEDFYGSSSLIGKGETFYLLGRLALSTVDTPPTIGLPYLSADQKATRVFIQDYITEAKFVIGRNSLKSAFVTVPDLRASQISLGLAVDLEWGTGPVFDGEDHNGIVLGQ